MKTIQNVSMLSLCGILLGCATKMETDDLDPALTCSNRVITIVHARGYLAMPQEYVEICRGKTLRINVVPPVQNRGARISPSKSNPDARWLDQEAENGRFIEIVISSEAEIDKTYKYDLTIDEVGMLDPRVRVVR